MKAVLVAALIALSPPALGADCFFASPSFSEIKIEVAGDHLTIHGPSGETERCGISAYSETPLLMAATCESGWGSDYVPGASSPEGDEVDILSFYGAIWYRQCMVPA